MRRKSAIAEWSEHLVSDGRRVSLEILKEQSARHFKPLGHGRGFQIDVGHFISSTRV